MEAIKEYVLDYIQREYTFPEDVDPMQINYVKSGYIDSMGMIMFIASIEDEFSIEFTDDDMANDEIKVVGSLIALIEKKINDK